MPVTLQKPYRSIGADLCRMESSESSMFHCAAAAMIPLSDLRLFILLPFGLAVLILLWMLWHLLRENKRR
jgi:hypothetical protein